MDLAQLHKELSSCRICKEYFGFEPRPVVFGNKNAKIMHISQSPSLAAAEAGLPFNDTSGKRLIHDWYKIDVETFYSPDKFYFTSISHCYTGKTASGNSRKPPLKCAKLWLEKELELVQNKMFIIIGAVAARYFFNQIPFDNLVFDSSLQLMGKPTVVLPHPSGANMAWFAKHPEFEKVALPRLQKRLQELLF